MFSIHQVVGHDLARHLGIAGREMSPDDLAATRLVLTKLLARPDCLAAVDLQRKPGGYARTLLFGDGRLSLWAMVWDAGAKTAIHDHHCACCFGVLAGSLTEITFRAVDKVTAVMTSRSVQAAGHVTCMVPTGPNLHQVVNDGPNEAISLHLYGYDHTARASSVHREYQLAVQ